MFLEKWRWIFLANYFSGKSFVNKVSLYGSYARGTALIKSDIDLVLEPDYSRLSGHGLDFLAMASELSLSLGAKVSITTENSFSPVFSQFASKDALVIYDRDGITNPDFPELKDDFNKVEYRDYARLVHIKSSLDLITSWSGKYSNENDNNGQLIISACLHELQIVAGLIRRLTPITQGEVLINATTSDSSNKIGSVHIASLLKNLTNAYFGVDTNVVLDIINHNIPAYLTSTNELLDKWDHRFKARLLKHFISYTESKVNISIRSSEIFAETLSEIRSMIAATLVKYSFLNLTSEIITEGERNLNWIAFQVNIRRGWKEILNGICPFFPIC